MEKILVLGINGFTGKHFQEFIMNNCLQDNFVFLGVDLAIDKRIGIDYFEANLLQEGIIEEILEKRTPDYIIDFVGLFNSPDFHSILDVNAGIAQRICEYIAKKDLLVKKILLVGSAAEYGPQTSLPIKEDFPLFPDSLYGSGKSHSNPICPFLPSSLWNKYQCCTFI